MACAGSRLSDTADSFLLTLPKPLFIQQHAHILFIPLFNFIFIYCGALSRAHASSNACRGLITRRQQRAGERERYKSRQKSNLKTILFTALLEFIKQTYCTCARLDFDTQARAHIRYVWRTSQVSPFNHSYPRLILFIPHRLLKEVHVADKQVKS